MSKRITYIRSQEADKQDVIRFFDDILKFKVDEFFHPHSFADADAENIVSYCGSDIYLFQACDGALSGYGMLRGWDEGYDIPSLGLAIHPKFQKMGLGCDFMKKLHKVARTKGALKIRLKVYSDNARAIALYQKLGYRFTSSEDGQKVAFLNL